jgi:hypothetical protein
MLTCGTVDDDADECEVLAESVVPELWTRPAEPGFQALVELPVDRKFATPVPAASMGHFPPASPSVLGVFCSMQHFGEYIFHSESFVVGGSSNFEGLKEYLSKTVRFMKNANGKINKCN